MRSPKLTEHQVLMMLELCLEAEERCKERIAAARATGEYTTAAYEVQLKEQYENMKTRLLDEMRYQGATTQDLHAVLQRIGRSIEKFSGSPDDIPPGSKPT